MRWVRRRVLFGVAAAVLTAAAGVYWGLPWCFPCPMPQELPQRAVTDRNGVLLSLAPLADHYRQQPLPAGEPLPEPLVNALLAAEDKRHLR